MAKVLNISDPKSGKSYKLEYTRRSVEQMERSGFVADDVTKKLMLSIPALWAGAFVAHHPTATRREIEDMYERMPDHQALLEKLAEMYAEPYEALMADPEEGSEGNMTWTASW